MVERSVEQQRLSCGCIPPSSCSTLMRNPWWPQMRKKVRQRPAADEALDIEVLEAEAELEARPDLGSRKGARDRDAEAAAARAEEARKRRARCVVQQCLTLWRCSSWLICEQKACSWGAVAAASSACCLSARQDGAHQCMILCLSTCAPSAHPTAYRGDAPMAGMANRVYP